MKTSINNLSLIIGTVNGSGSQSSNLILLRSIYRMGIPVGGKNLFPSNIAGLPTWFVIRVNEKGYTSIPPKMDIVVAMNQQTADDDISHLNPEGLFIYNSSLRFTKPLPTNSISVEFAKIAGQVNDSIKLKKLLTNIVYVGVLAEMLGIPDEILHTTIADQFNNKKSVVDLNIAAAQAGREYFKNQIQWRSPWKLESRDLNKGKILIDGNTAAGLGSVFAGCSFAAWYPITPSSSLAESFEAYCHKLRKDSQNKNLFSVIQAEDELSAITMVAGAGWAGARAMTATSGPGISLMAETAGLMYFAEIPGVVWNVQRAGPSTGLPTRTLQGDILACAYLSHGDTRHPLLFPSTPEECFSMAEMAFDLADQLQTLVFVMSDLDLGMNYWICNDFTYSKKPFARGKVLHKEDLKKLQKFNRYKDTDGDGIAYRTLPGTEHDLAGYFTRGTGHDEAAKYTESPEVFEALLNRLDRKWETAKKMMPASDVDLQNTELGLVAYGTTHTVMQELRDALKSQGIASSYLRIKSFPFDSKVESFLASHKKIIVLEQNRDGQMKKLLMQEFPQHANRLKSSLSYDGWPSRFQTFLEGVLHGH
jgi:2-oxoglutarate/2-oxoacid ferredoxin oxidoreductase subunit alpha